MKNEKGGFCEGELDLNCQVSAQRLSFSLREGFKNQRLSLFHRMLYFIITEILQSEKKYFLSEMGL